jgi:hypothetical protein
MYRDNEQRDFARRLRNIPTGAEKQLWFFFRAGQLDWLDRPPPASVRPPRPLRRQRIRSQRESVRSEALAYMPSRRRWASGGIADDLDENPVSRKRRADSTALLTEKEKEKKKKEKGTGVKCDLRLPSGSVENVRC